jgi:hypothetical protein
MYGLKPNSLFIYFYFSLLLPEPIDETLDETYHVWSQLKSVLGTPSFGITEQERENAVQNLMVASKKSGSQFKPGVFFRELADTFGVTLTVADYKHALSIAMQRNKEDIHADFAYFWIQDALPDCDGRKPEEITQLVALAQSLPQAFTIGNIHADSPLHGIWLALSEYIAAPLIAEFEEQDAQETA